MEYVSAIPSASGQTPAARGAGESNMYISAILSASAQTPAIGAHNR
jgi:hypothetical protein